MSPKTKNTTATIAETRTTPVEYPCRRTEVPGTKRSDQELASMRDLLETYKPAAAARVHLLLAAAVWTTVGALLSYFGTRWTFAARMPQVWLFVLAAVTVGLLKGRFVLDRTAARMIGRIRARGDGRCIGGFLSWRSWVLVALMAGSGRLLRGGLLPRAVVGLIYVAVGIALLVGSRRFWHAWNVFDSE